MNAITDNGCASAHRRLDSVEKRVDDSTRRVDHIYGLLIGVLTSSLLTLLAVLLKP